METEASGDAAAIGVRRVASTFGPTRDGTVTTNDGSLARRRRCGRRPDLARDPADPLDSVLKPTLALGCVDEQDGTDHEGNPGNENDPGTHRIPSRALWRDDRPEATRLARRRGRGKRPGLVGDPAGRLDSVLDPTAALGRVDEQDRSDQQTNSGNQRETWSHTQVIGAAETCPERLDGVPR
jgi:hypothetical protein